MALACVRALAFPFIASADAHRFAGAWITDAEMAAQTPKPVKARQLQRNLRPEPDARLRNRHILFRRAFDLGTVKDARVYVTADDHYKLHVNGDDADVREGKVCTDLHNVVNAWYVGAVKCMNAIAARLGQPRHADATPLEAAFQRVFRDADRALFVDREGPRHVSLPGNCYAVLFGLEPKADGAAFRREYLRLVREKGCMSISMFQFVPLFACLKTKGERMLLRQMIASPDAWLRILREGGTRTFEG